jgi:hypothetical protein
MQKRNRRLALRSTAAIGLTIALCTAGCASGRRGIQRLAASHLAATATSFNLAIEQTQNEMLLLNVIRAMDHQPMYVTDASKVTGTVKADISLGFKLPFRPMAPSNDYSAAPNFDFSSTPSMDVNLLNSKDFMTGFLAPISPDFLAYYWDQGWSSELLLYLLVLRVDVFQATANGDFALKCSVHNHPDVFEKDLHKLKEFASWVQSQVANGRPRLVADEAKESAVGPPLTVDKIDVLVAIAKEPTLGISPVEKTSTWQLKRPKKTYTLVPVPASNPIHTFACSAENEVPGAASPPNKAYEALQQESAEKGQVLTPRRDAPNAQVFALTLRSPEGLLYYLGQLARVAAARAHQTGGRAVLIHVTDFGRHCDEKQIAGKARSCQPDLLPLFVARKKTLLDSCGEDTVAVRSLDGSTYLIPQGEGNLIAFENAVFLDGNGNPVPPEKAAPLDLALPLVDVKGLCSAGRSMTTFTLAADLIGLQKTGKDFSTTSTVKVVGQ